MVAFILKPLRVCSHRSPFCRLRRRSFADAFDVNSIPSRNFGERTFASLTPKDKAYDNINHEFFRYTSGRWLWNEDEQSRERYRRFDVLELQRAAAKAIGSRCCAEMFKIGEGNCNKVFKLIMNDRAVVIARIPHPNAGPATITTASEVATMDFARSALDIPVPKVLAYCTTAANPVRSEYIIMEEAKGVQLSNVWDTMEIDDQAKIVRSIVEIEAKCLMISVDRAGALFYAKDMPNCSPLQVRGEISQAVKEDVQHRFVMGPTVEKGFWETERTQMDLDRGPWTLAGEYVEAIGHREMKWIDLYAKPKSPAIPLSTSTAQNSPVAHIELLRKYLSVVSKLLPSEEELLLPTLWHRDLHRGNVFVHEGEVSSIIDWQSVWVGPRILRARTPQLVDYNGEVQTRLPENFKSLEPEEKDRVRAMVRKSILLYSYETSTARRNPSLFKVLRYPNGKTLDQLVEFASNSWDGDILPLREVLIRIERDWHLIDATSTCPYHFSEEEIAQHRRDGEGFNELADFWDNLDGRVDRTGYTTIENFQDAVQYFSELRKAGLETLVGEERRNFELQTRWLLDHQDVDK